MTASVFAFLSWAGFESGSSLGEETANPKRTVPLSLLLAVIIGGFLYVFVMFAQVNGFGTDEKGVAMFAESSSTLTQLGSMYIGQWFSVLISVIAFAVAFGAFLSSSTATSRLIHTLARDGFGPSTFANRDSKTFIPKSSVWATNIIGLLLALALGAAGRTSVEIYYWYATIATLCMVVAYGMASVGAIKFILKKHSSVGNHLSATCCGLSSLRLLHSSCRPRGAVHLLPLDFRGLVPSRTHNRLGKTPIS